jgi:protein-disulfide isomerase
LTRFLQIFVIFMAILVGTVGAALALTTEEMLAEGAIGDEKAPVTIVEYASLTCPHCADFTTNTFDAFKAKYIDTGKVRYIYRDFPLDQVSIRAAMMVRCAGPEHFYGLLAALFKSQETWAAAKDPIEELAKYGRLAGLSKEQFDACMANKDLLDGIVKVELDAQEQLKVSATPTFIVNGIKHEGNKSLEEFDKILAPLIK